MSDYELTAKGDSTPSPRTSTGAITYNPSVQLSEREYASLQKVASYRALVGKQAAETRRLRGLFRDIQTQTHDPVIAALCKQGLEGER